MIRYFVHRDGRTEEQPSIDPAWLAPDSGVYVWADLPEPGARRSACYGTSSSCTISRSKTRSTRPTSRRSRRTTGTCTSYSGINFQREAHEFDTYDTDFVVSASYLVTVHDGKRRSVAQVADQCSRSAFVLSEGPVALMHRIVDTMVSHYRPEIDEVEDRLDELEDHVVESGRQSLIQDILAVKRDITMLRRVLVPQRDVAGRLARREFPLIGQEMSYRFRDVYDQLVRFSEDALMFHDRVTGILDAHLATVSNRLAQVSKLLAVIATLFGPLTVITGLFGMNVPLPAFPGGQAAQFWWIIGVMAAASVGMFLWFRRTGWL